MISVAISSRAKRASLVCGLLLLVACGKKGAPLPPLRAAPPRPEQVRVIQRGQELLISWADQAILPPKAPGALAKIELMSTTGDAKEFETRAKRYVVVEPSQLDLMGGRRVLRVTPPTSTGAHAWAVRLISRSGAPSPLSQPLVWEPTELMATPPAPVLRLVRSGVELVGASADQRIYRRTENGVFGSQPIAVDKEGRDPLVQVGETWCYATTSGNSAVESELGPEACITIRDVVAPDAPSQLVASVIDGPAVLLIWRPSKESDVVGYNVYRRLEGGEVELLTEVPLKLPRFKDRSIAKGLYSYAVTALDTAEPANESEKTAEESVRVGP